MSNVNLTRLWYIFPPDDQELRPAQFSNKVRSYVSPLPESDKLAVLDFLLVQYAAFERQLDIMREGSVLNRREHQQRAVKLSQHRSVLQDLRRAATSMCS